MHIWTLEQVLRLSGYLIVLSIALCGQAGTVAIQPADRVVLNGDVYTVDPDTPRVEAFAVRNGRFIATGSSERIAAWIGAETVVSDVHGATVVPGLIDGHTHLASGMNLATGVNLTEIADKQEWLGLIAAAVDKLPEGGWLLGGNWDHTLSDGILPTRQMLDAVSPHNPVFLNDIDGHSYWVNTRALTLAQITADTPVPAGGEIVLDSQSKMPTGILKEGAGALVRSIPGFKAAADPGAGLPAIITLANSLGITGVHDMGEYTDKLREMADSQALTLRVWRGRFGLDSAQKIQAYALERDAVKVQLSESQTHTGPVLELGYVKLIVDGVLSTHTALMKQPYSDQPAANPAPITDQKTLNRLVMAAHANGFPVAIHAIGDRAVAMALNAFAGSPVQEGAQADRIEHIEVVTPDDIKRFASLNVAASMQPHHATCCVGNYVIDRIGEARMPNAYAWRSVLDAGVALVLGSDFPTSPLSPLIQIGDAMARLTRINGEQESWDTEATLSFEEALAAYTQSAANLTPWKHEVGSISVGKWADYVVLDGALGVPTPQAVLKRSVQSTYLAGKVVYSRP